jgi:hypothetical protein
MEKNFTEMKGLCDRLELNDADVSDSHFENNTSSCDRFSCSVLFIIPIFFLSYMHPQFVALIIGTLGLNKGRQLDARGPLYNEEMSTFAPCLGLIAEGLWKDIGSDSNARFMEDLRPEAGQRHYISIGEGMEGEAMPWATLPITETDDFDLDKDYSNYPSLKVLYECCVCVLC